MAIGKDSINSVIGPGSIFEGKFYIAGSLRIDGKFEGDIKTEDALVIGETGKVKTKHQRKRSHCIRYPHRKHQSRKRSKTRRYRTYVR